MKVFQLLLAAGLLIASSDCFLLQSSTSTAFTSPPGLSGSLGHVSPSSHRHSALAISPMSLRKRTDRAKIQQSMSATSTGAKAVGAAKGLSLASAGILFATAEGLPALLAASLGASLLGFIRFRWFFSISYGLSMVLMAFWSLTHFSAIATVPQVALLHLCLTIAWGVRLAGYLAWREVYGGESYKERARGFGKGTPILRKIGTWLFVAIFDALLFCPALFHLKTPTRLEALAYAGIVMQLVGLVIESESDKQKSAMKAANPDGFCNEGLYKVCRHPNYLGEIVFWTGNYVAGLASLSGVAQFVLATVGVAMIIAVMLGATAGLDRRQSLKYGQLPAYAQYVQSTPKLLPLGKGDDLVTLIKEAEGKKPASSDGGESDETARDLSPRSVYAKNKQPWDI